MTHSAPPTGIRGPADHAVREQIVQAADQHFRHYGYAKTTVSDLAKSIGFSKAYIYRFFDSKQAVGEAVCTACMGGLLAEVTAAVAEGRSATDKFRRYFRAIVEGSVRQMFEERKLHDIAVHASLEKWGSALAYQERLMAILQDILAEGRGNGEFERKTPFDETCRAITYAMLPFIHPVMLEQQLDQLPDGPNELTGLILRSLAP